MVFSEEDKAIIKHYYKERKFTPYKIWKDSLDNPERKWDITSVKKLCNRIDKFGSAARRVRQSKKGDSGPANQEQVEELIMSQEEPGTHTHPQNIADELSISFSSVQRICRENISISTNV